MSRRRKVYVHDFNTHRPNSRRATSPYIDAPIFNLLTQIKRTYGHSKKNAYEACVSINSSGRSRHRRAADEREACGYGPAPRRALGKALTKLGRAITKRSSAFRGA